MLQTVLAFAIPTIITLSAAFFLLGRVNKNEEENRRSRYPRNDKNSNGGGQYSSSARRRRQLPFYDTECAICFDKKKLVELYPCGHKDFCADCIDMVIVKSKRLCPFCRNGIRGYSDE